MSDYVKITGADVDNIEDASAITLEIKVKGAEPYFEKAGEDTEKAGGSIKGSRYKQLFISVKYVPFELGNDFTSELNNFKTYLDLQNVLDKEFTWLKETNLVRKIDANNFWTPLLPIKIELIEEDKTADYEKGVEDLAQTFRTKEYMPISDIVTW